MLYLAKRPVGSCCNTADIAREEQIPASFLAKVINQLAKGGLVTSRRGPLGGLELAREPSAITLREIVEIIEGEIAMNLCTSSQEYACFRSGCALKPAFSAAQAAYLQQLDAITLASLVRNDRYTADAPLTAPIA